jgi:hypothetical protein
MTTTETAANATSTGSMGLVVALLGVEPQAILWTTMGSIIGVVLAPKTGTLYAIALFCASTMACALFATGISVSYFQGSEMSRNIAAVLLGAAFHPGLKVFIERSADVVAAWINRIATALGSSGGPK